MPELIEVEHYRRLAAEAVTGRRITEVVAEDAWYLKGGIDQTTLSAAIVGTSVRGARRRGKLLLLDVADVGDVARGGVGVLGLRFGMSGRLVVDGQAPIGRLLYAPAVSDPRFDRFALGFSDGGSLRMSDPRRLGGVELDPVEDRLGPDALHLSSTQLTTALASSRAPVKARLLDQRRIAGIGNLLADEMLWRAGLSPKRGCDGLGAAERRRLHRHLRATLDDLLERGGSHLGDLMGERHPGGHCPRDGRPLARDVVGGRTTWWCPAHQR